MFFKCNLKLRTITAKLRIGKEGMKVRNALIVAVLLIAVLFAFKLLAMPEVEVSDIDLSKVRDGSYIGEYKAGPVKAVVQVDVKDQQIADIKIKEHVHSIGKKCRRYHKTGFGKAVFGCRRSKRRHCKQQRDPQSSAGGPGKKAPANPF